MAFFFHTAAIWTERNVFLMGTYWPRRCYLEIGGFQPSKDEENVMRIPKDDDRPKLRFRALEYVIADRAAPHGWRALRWQDLPEFVDASVLASVLLPFRKIFRTWMMDPAELPSPILMIALVRHGNAEPQPRRDARTSGAAAHKKENRRPRRSGWLIAEWLDWTQWSVDKIKMQRTAVVDPRRYGAVVNAQALTDIFAALEDQAGYPSMGRTLRKLPIPALVVVSYRGEESTNSDPIENPARNVFTASLTALEKSKRFRFQRLARR